MIRLLHGDCRELLPLPADVIITDPPYGVDRDGNMLGELATNYHSDGAHTRGYAAHAPLKYHDLMTTAFMGMRDSLPKGGTLITWGHPRTLDETITYAKYAGFQVLDYIVFRRGSNFAKSTSMLIPRFELAVYMRKPGGVRVINSTRNLDNLYELRGDKASTVDMKPVADITKLLEIFSQPGDIVGDPFMGNGIIPLLAARYGRQTWGIELVKERYDIACNRVDKAATI